MSLPIFQSDSQALTLLQTNWASLINPVLNLPTNNGHLLKNVALQSGSNVINHLLGKKLQGWFTVRVRASATFYDLQDSNPTPALTLVLEASANVVVDLFVF